jgi:formyl-CoA transferase
LSSGTGAGGGPPLAGVHVVEIASYVTGPYAVAILAELGAQVTKIEEPTEGDPFRGWGKGGYSPTFRSVNRGKRSIGLDLRSAEGVAVARRLIATADVLVENLRPGALARLGLDPAELQREHPDLIVCSISGFGDHGPYRDRPGYDTVGQAVSGLLGLLTDLDEPRPMGVSLSDHLTGMSAAIGILAAIAGRERGAAGRRVTTSLLQATTAFVAENAARYFDDDVVPSRETRAQIAQAYAFRAGDGGPFVVHLSSPQKFWVGLANAIGRPELAEDPRFANRAARVRNYEELHTLLSEAFQTADRATWLAALDAHDVPAGPINRLDEVFADPGVQALDLVHEVVHPTAGPMRLVASGVSVEGADETSGHPPPLLGEHGEAILLEAGYAQDEVAALRSTGVLR